MKPSHVLSASPPRFKPDTVQLNTLQDWLGYGKSPFKLGDVVRLVSNHGGTLAADIPVGGIGVVTAPHVVCDCCGMEGPRVAMLVGDGVEEIGLPPSCLRHLTQADMDQPWTDGATQ